MKVEDLDLIFIKFDKQVIISDKEGIIDKDSSIDFSLILEHNIRYDLFEIISNISKNIYNYNEEFEISKENENYNILNKKFHIDYFLDDLLIEFFKMLDKKIYTSYKQHINKIILIPQLTQSNLPMSNPLKKFLKIKNLNMIKTAKI